MVLALLPLVLTVVTLVAVARAMAQVIDEADQLRTAVARVQTLRPVVAEIGAGARSLSSGLGRLGR
jgi:hypothetical protein